LEPVLVVLLEDWHTSASSVEEGHDSMRQVGHEMVPMHQVLLELATGKAGGWHKREAGNTSVGRCSSSYQKLIGHQTEVGREYSTERVTQNLANPPPMFGHFGFPPLHWNLCFLDVGDFLPTMLGSLDEDPPLPVPLSEARSHHQ